MPLSSITAVLPAQQEAQPPQAPACHHTGSSKALQQAAGAWGAAGVCTHPTHLPVHSSRRRPSSCSAAMAKWEVRVVPPRMQQHQACSSQARAALQLRESVTRSPACGGNVPGRRRRPGAELTTPRAAAAARVAPHAAPRPALGRGAAGRRHQRRRLALVRAARLPGGVLCVCGHQSKLTRRGARARIRSQPSLRGPAACPATRAPRPAGRTKTGLRGPRRGWSRCCQSCRQQRRATCASAP